jgi:L-ascorbate metabolism protein UlaG (beta-lactamase superfamily)
MRLKWYGHASFRVTADNGTSIITDPYTPETSGFKPFTEPPDIVIMSSDNDPFHCRADLVPGSPVVINALQLAQSGGSRVEQGITISAIEAMEALDHREHDPDQNGMYRFTVDGISIGHMGDVGNPFSAEQIDFFRDVDVLLALTGGHPTIDLDDLKVVIDEARPKLVIPMHFRTLRSKLSNILWVESFLNYFRDEDVDFACDCEVDLEREDIPQQTRVLVMDYL